MIGVFFIATSWGRQNGGVNSVNYSLIRSFAKIINKEEWDIYCVLTDERVDSDIIEIVFDNENITLINTKTPANSTKIKKIIKEKNYEQLFFVGHDVITGQYANSLRNNYENSISVVFHHMYYQSYYYSREFDPEKIRKKEELQNEIVPKADIVVAVGPSLYKSAKDLCINARTNPKIHEIIPGLEDSNPITDIHNHHTIILFGRLEERNNAVKQMGLAIDALADYIKDKEDSYLIKCYGYADDSEKNQKQLLKQAYKQAGKAVNIRANRYIDDEDKLREEISRASLCIMPSFCEGFGLTAYEAISEGVPVIISQNTGLYEFLDKKPGDRITHLFESVKISGNPTDIKKPYTDNDLKNLKKCIDNIFKDYKKSKNNALDLRQKLMESHYNWDYTARKFLGILQEEIKIVPKKGPKGKVILKKEKMDLSTYITDKLVSQYCGEICNPQKAVLKIIKYSYNRERRFTVYSSDTYYKTNNQRMKVRTINDGTVGVLNNIFNKGEISFPLIISDFTERKCYCVTEEKIFPLKDIGLGVPDHQVLAILAVPLVYKDSIVGALTIDIYDGVFIKKYNENKEEISKIIYSWLKALTTNLITHFYYDIKDDINFCEVKKMLTKREIVSFKGECPLKCKHCFARDIVKSDEIEDEIEDIIKYLSEKEFEVVYVSHYKENFYNANKGVSLCEAIYDNFQCDICVTTRCILTSKDLDRINKLNEKMNLNGNNLTFCISIPAYDSFNKIENERLVPTPQQRIDFAGQLKQAGITSVVTIRPMFPNAIISGKEIKKIVDCCVDKVDAILTGGLYVSDEILKRLDMKKYNISYLDDTESDYLIGVEKEFRAVNVNQEINELEEYCHEKQIPFFRHSMEALNYFKE